MPTSVAKTEVGRCHGGADTRVGWDFDILDSFNHMTQRTIVLLTLNEVDGVRWLLKQGSDLSEMANEVLAVDGGSTDGTREALAAAGIRVVDQARWGRGEAFRAGVAASVGDHLVFFSPDGNEDPGDIPGLFRVLAEGADIVIASRFLLGARNEEDDAFLPLRKWTNQAFTAMANALWNRGSYVSDTINGFRGITRTAFERLGLESMGYTIEYEMTVRAMQQGMQIVEIPTVEGDRVGGETKAPSFRTGIRFLRFLIREFFKE